MAVRTVDLKSTGAVVGCYELFCTGINVETPGDGAGWDGRQCTWQHWDVIISFVLYFVSHLTNKVRLLILVVLSLDAGCIWRIRHAPPLSLKASHSPQ
jgi:hypothetical protein